MVSSRNRCQFVLAMLLASVGLLSCGGGGGGAIPASGATAAGQVFFDDFESGSAAKWESEGSRTKAIAVALAQDGGTPHGGSGMLQINWNGTLPFDDPDAYTPVVLPSWSYNKEFFIRMWWRLDTDFGTNCGGCSGPGEGTKFMRLNQGGANGASWGVISIEGNGGWLHEYYFDPDTGDTISNNFAVFNLFDHLWHRQEFYVKVDATAGVIRRWIDGVLKYEFLGKTTGLPWYPLILGSNWSLNPGWEHSANNHLYVDDVEIFSDTGTGATGSMANATVKQ